MGVEEEFAKELAKQLGDKPIAFLLSVTNKIQIALNAGFPPDRSGGLTSPVRPNSKFSISFDGMASCAAIWVFVTPSFHSSVRIICQTLERSGARPLGSSVPYF